MNRRNYWIAAHWGNGLGVPHRSLVAHGIALEVDGAVLGIDGLARAVEFIEVVRGDIALEVLVPGLVAGCVFTGGFLARMARRIISHCPENSPFGNRMR